MLIVDSTVGTNYIFCIDKKKLITVAGLRQLGPSINNTQDRPAVSNNNKLMNRRLYIGGKVEQEVLNFYFFSCASNSGKRNLFSSHLRLLSSG
jgi:hypothetical protein